MDYSFPSVIWPTPHRPQDPSARSRIAVAWLTMGDGGIGLIRLPARRNVLIDAVDQKAHPLNIRLRHRESDNVRNPAPNAL